MICNNLTKLKYKSLLFNEDSTSPEPSVINVLQGLSWLFSDLKGGDSLIVYYAGMSSQFCMHRQQSRFGIVLKDDFLEIGIHLLKHLHKAPEEKTNQVACDESWKDTVHAIIHHKHSSPIRIHIPDIEEERLFLMNSIKSRYEILEEHLPGLLKKKKISHEQLEHHLSYSNSIQINIFGASASTFPAFEVPLFFLAKRNTQVLQPSASSSPLTVPSGRPKNHNETLSSFFQEPWENISLIFQNMFNVHSPSALPSPRNLEGNLQRQARTVGLFSYCLSSILDEVTSALHNNIFVSVLNGFNLLLKEKSKIDQLIASSTPRLQQVFFLTTTKYLDPPHTAPLLSLPPRYVEKLMEKINSSHISVDNVRSLLLKKMHLESNIRLCQMQVNALRLPWMRKLESEAMKSENPTEAMKALLVSCQLDNCCPKLDGEVEKMEWEKASRETQQAIAILSKSNIQAKKFTVM